MKLEILTNITELQQEENQRKGSCRVWLKIGGYCFPEDNWFDFLFILLPDWSFKLTEIISKNLGRRVIRFVDGDYAVEFVLIHGDKYKISFGRWDMFDDVFDKTEQNNYEVNIKEFAKTLSKTNEMVIEYTQNENITSEYFETLQDWNGKLLEVLNETGFKR